MLHLQKASRFFVPPQRVMISVAPFVQSRILSNPGEYFPYKYFILKWKKFKLIFSLNIIIKQVLVCLTVFSIKKKPCRVAWKKDLSKVNKDFKRDLYINQVQARTQASYLNDTLSGFNNWLCHVRTYVYF